jgi:hypothetical protein
MKCAERPFKPRLLILTHRHYNSISNILILARIILNSKAAGLVYYTERKLFKSRLLLLDSHT